MASIVFSNLERTTTIRNVVGTTYTDLHLDIAATPKGAERDIVVDIDVDAIRNSLSNLFTTKPGQKLLNPVYGLNLLQFLFEPITKYNANRIGEVILSGIEKYEPRVTVDKIQVKGNAELNEYNIVLVIKIPNLTSINSVTLNSVLSQKSSFTFL